MKKERHVRELRVHGRKEQKLAVAYVSAAEAAIVNGRSCNYKLAEGWFQSYPEILCRRGIRNYNIHRFNNRFEIVEESSGCNSSFYC